MLLRDPSARYNSSQALEDPWFKMEEPAKGGKSLKNKSKKYKNRKRSNKTIRKNKDTL